MDGLSADPSPWRIRINAWSTKSWGLPFQIVEAVANHHAPERHLDARVGLAQLVWLAACIVDGEPPQVEALHRFGVEELCKTNRRAFEATGAIPRSEARSEER